MHEKKICCDSHVTLAVYLFVAGKPPIRPGSAESTSIIDLVENGMYLSKHDIEMYVQHLYSMNFYVKLPSLTL